MPNLSSLTASLKVTATWSASVNVTGSDYSAPSSNCTINKTTAVGTATANAAVGGGDELHSKLYSIAGAGTTTIDLTALVDILLQTGVSLARVKGFLFRLLSVADDAVSGTACSQVTVGNAATNANALDMGAQTHTRVLKNGDWTGWGTSLAAGLVVDGTHKSILVTNNDAVVTAAFQVTILGGTT